MLQTNDVSSSFDTVLLELPQRLLALPEEFMLDRVLRKWVTCKMRSKSGTKSARGYKLTQKTRKYIHVCAHIVTHISAQAKQVRVVQETERERYKIQ
jgi:membrane carboxypeptidase/penicillin-binding protein PbpC